MSNVLIFDFEISGLPEWKIPSDDPKQPHIVQVGAILCDDETQEIKEELDVIVKPDGWEIDKETSDIHGITQEKALEVGIPEIEALEKFMALYDQCCLRVAHNTTFDNRIARIALKRFMPDRVTDEDWKNRDLYYCTLFNSKKIMGGRSGHTLAEALLHFTGKTLENAHSALPDARACMDIYFAIKSGVTKFEGDKSD